MVLRCGTRPSSPSSPCVPRRRVGRAELDRSRAGSGPISVWGVVVVGVAHGRLKPLRSESWFLLESRDSPAIVACGGRAPMCGEGGSMHMGAEPRSLLTLLSRMIPQSPPTQSTREYATPTTPSPRRPRGHRQSAGQQSCRACQASRLTQASAPTAPDSGVNQPSTSAPRSVHLTAGQQDMRAPAAPDQRDFGRARSTGHNADL